MVGHVVGSRRAAARQRDRESKPERGYPHRPHELLAFWLGWTPATPGPWRWADRREFLADWRQYRSAIDAKHPRATPAFADLAGRYRRRHGPAALEAATIEDILRGDPSWPRRIN